MRSADELRHLGVPLRSARRYEDFVVGQVLKHRWGRTLLQSDSVTLSALTLHYNPIYFNLDLAAREGHPAGVVNPLLVFLVAFGLTVEDCSEGGGALLAVESVAFPRSVSAGETIYARSTVAAMRESRSRPDHGIVTWESVGVDAHDNTVVQFRRTNLVLKRLAVG